MMKMKKLKVLCFTILATFLCVLNVDAKQVDTAENSSGGNIAITHNLTGELKYQWVHVEYSDYTAKETQLKGLVTEINSLASDYNAQAEKVRKAIEEYETALGAGASRTELGVYYAAVENENAILEQKKAAYDAKEDEFNSIVESIAPRGNTWQPVNGNSIPFDGTGYTQADAAVLWINTGDAERPYESSIYMYDETDGSLKKEVNCPVVNHYCEVVDGVYYDPAGRVVTQKEYENACLPKVCKIDGDKYYGVDGKEVTEAEYKAECEKNVVTPTNPTCKVENGKYYDKKGKEVSKEEYEKACNPVCKIDNGKYYGPEGQELSKEKYEELCPKNPKTGMSLPITLGLTIVLISIAGVIVVNKKKMFKQI